MGTFQPPQSVVRDVAGRSPGGSWSKSLQLPLNHASVTWDIEHWMIWGLLSEAVSMIQLLQMNH